MICNMDKEENSGQMVHFLKEIITKEKKMDMGNLNLLTHRCLKVILFRIVLRGMDNIYGQMGESIQGNGLIIRFMGVVNMLGQMEEGTKVSTNMILNTDMEYSHGPTADNMMVPGNLVINTDMENIALKKEK